MLTLCIQAVLLVLPRAKSHAPFPVSSSLPSSSSLKPLPALKRSASSDPPKIPPALAPILADLHTRTSALTTENALLRSLLHKKPTQEGADADDDELDGVDLEAVVRRLREVLSENEELGIALDRLKATGGGTNKEKELRRALEGQSLLPFSLSDQRTHTAPPLPCSLGHGDARRSSFPSYPILSHLACTATLVISIDHQPGIFGFRLLSPVI